MTEGHLQGIGNGVSWLCHGRQDASGGGSDVGAQGQWVHALDLDDADANERSEAGREDGAALDEDGEAGADQDGQVAGHARHVAGEVGVDERLDDDGDLALQQPVQ